ncbi:MAG: hypothetical protein R3185_03955 [Candidatus Thermoplasmatota archaeon]|nr:hypothetical protein [Candidatus Thermoplasmatota archaeon]
MSRSPWVVAAVAGVLVLGLVGVLVYEAGRTPDPSLTFPVTWSTSPAGGQERQGDLEEEENETFTFQLGSPNVTSVQVALTWTDDSGDPDRFNLSVVGPDGIEPVRRNGSNGSVVLRIPVAPVPTVEQAQGPSRDRVEASLARSHASSAGVGGWQVTVGLEDAPGQRPVPQAQDLETQPDGSNSFVLTFSYTVYRAQVADPTV